MALEDLNEKLYGRDIHLDRTEKHTPFDPERGGTDLNVEGQFRKDEEWQAPVPKTDPIKVLTDVATNKRTKKIAFFLGGLAVILLLGGTVIKIRTMIFSENQVVVSISGPKDVASVEVTTFTVTYANDNWAGLDNMTLILTYPETFHLQAENTMRVSGSRAEIPIGKISARAQGKIMVKGKFYGSKGDKLDLRAILRYSPSNVSTILEKATQLTVTVGSSPLSLEITAPLELATGQDVEYLFEYSNKSDLSFSNLRVKAEYPDGFRFVSAEPAPSEGESVWYVGNLSVGAKGKITIHGVIIGKNQEYKTIRGTIGFFGGDGKFVSYEANDRQIQMIVSPLSISQSVNRLTDIAVKAGDVLQYAIHYRNDGNIGLRDAIITVEIDPTFLDVNRLLVENGAYDPARRVIVWKASDVPELGKLAPGDEGDVFFNVPVLEKIDVNSGKNLSIKTVAKIDSLDVPTPIGANKIIASDNLYVKLQSSVVVSVSTLYTDTIFPNSGPIPPKAGQETSYTIHLNVTNSSNDLRSARVVITLPTGVRYAGKYFKPEEVLTYNERSNELVWELGTFSATEGKPHEIVFQVSVLPGSDQIGNTLDLINSIVLTAYDTFIKQDIRVEKGRQSNTLGDDSVYGSFSNNASMVEKAD